MCELLGMSARYETNLNDSLSVFRKRGGEIGPHADGWGVAMYRDDSLQVTKEPEPAADSPYLECFQEGDLRSDLILAHIRRANPPEVGRFYANTHPFVRTVGEKSWVFAHNGKITNLEPFEPKGFQPKGETDSERIFCWLLDNLTSDSTESLEGSDPAGFLERLEPLVSRVNREGEFNFFLSNGSWLVAHGHNRLYKLSRTCSREGCEQRVLLLASEPLSDERWSSVAPNRLVLTRDGGIIAEQPTRGKALENPKTGSGT